MQSVTLPTCAGCVGFVSCFKTGMEVRGVKLSPGCRYCVWERPRRFSGKAANPRTPDWCPRRKNPCELRIYDFKSTRDRTMHTLFACETGKAASPEPRRYAVAYEGQTELTPRSFWVACNQVPAVELIGQEVRRYAIVEIDDGIRPYCFYKSEMHFVPLPYFKTETARNNAMEDDA